MGIDEQIANLTPEKRDLLLKKLKERRPKPEMPQPAPVGGRLFDPERDQNFRLHASRPGILDSLVYQVTQRRKPGPTEIEVEVFASSLNFGDVMVAIGLYPKSPVMGSDCAGWVVATGERVDHVKVGDEVIVMAVDVSCFSRYITVAGFAAVPKPRYLSFEEAATIPTVFLTVYYSLYSLAQIEKGERILSSQGLEAWAWPRFSMPGGWTPKSIQRSGPRRRGDIFSRWALSVFSTPVPWISPKV